MTRTPTSLEGAWAVYDQWLGDPRVEFYPEPRGLDAAFRAATAPVADKAASNWVGDCYLLAVAGKSEATLVTFDKTPFSEARKRGYAAIIPA